MRAAQGAAETLYYAERQKLEAKLLAEQQETIKIKQIGEAERRLLDTSVSLPREYWGCMELLLSQTN